MALRSVYRYLPNVMEPTMNSLKDLENAASGTQVDLSRFLDWVPFNEQGLVPAIAQDHTTGNVLMLAWMNREAIEQTLTTRPNRLFFSQSSGAVAQRRDLWQYPRLGLFAIRLRCRRHFALGKPTGPSLPHGSNPLFLSRRARRQCCCRRRTSKLAGPHARIHSFDIGA